MDDIERFLAAAIRVERDAALRYDELADAISGLGHPEVVTFFRKQALYSRRHLEEAKARAGFREPWDDGTPAGADGAAQPAAAPDFGDGESPEAAAIWAADGQLTLDQAMEVALDAEEAGRAYYAATAASSSDPEVRYMAGQFAEEETGHVQALKALMAKLSRA